MLNRLVLGPEAARAREYRKSSKRSVIETKPPGVVRLTSAPQKSGQRTGVLWSLSEENGQSARVPMRRGRPMRRRRDEILHGDYNRFMNAYMVWLSH